MREEEGERLSRGGGEVRPPLRCAPLPLCPPLSPSGARTALSEARGARPNGRGEAKRGGGGSAREIKMSAGEKFNPSAAGAPSEGVARNTLRAARPPGLREGAGPGGRGAHLRARPCGAATAEANSPLNLPASPPPSPSLLPSLPRSPSYRLSSSSPSASSRERDSRPSPTMHRARRAPSAPPE